MGLPYPGGPEIEKLAKKGNSAAIPFPRPMLYSKDYDFSFSGLKTSVLYYLRDKKSPTPALMADVASSFQAAAIEVIVAKTKKAVREYGTHSVFLSGGVAANKTLRKTLAQNCRKLKVVFLPTPIKYNGDNAVMIAVAAYIRNLQGKKYPLMARGQLGV